MKMSSILGGLNKVPPKQQTAEVLSVDEKHDTILQLFKAAHEEQLANIRQARDNALCTRAEDMKPYQKTAFLALFQKVAGVTKLEGETPPTSEQPSP